MQKKKKHVRCPYDGYTWWTSSQMKYVTCPFGLHKFEADANLVPEKEQDVVLEHFNLDEDGVRILDRSIGERGWVVDVYFKPNKAWCSYCESENCNHVKFALSVPDVQKILKKKGWEIET